jgi:hypothetical protein
MSGKKHNRISFGLLLILFVLYVAAVLPGIKQLWGLNIAKFLPAWWSWLTVVATAATLLPRVSRRLPALLGEFSRKLAADKAKRLVFLLLLSGALLPIWLIFYSKGYFLGDATLRLNLIAGGQLWLPTEIGDFFIHSIIDRLVLEPFGCQVALGYHVISALCGLAFLIGAYRLALYLKPSRSLFIFLIMMSSGMTVMFFGYIESYSILAALLPYFILSALKVIDGKSGSTVFFILFILTVVMHSMAIVILTGFFVMTLIISRVGIDRARRISLCLIFLIIIGIVSVYIARAVGIGWAQRYFLAPLPSEDYRQGIFTLNHPLNIFNWLCISALPSMVIFASLPRKGRKEENDSDRRRIIPAIWMIVPAVVFMFFFIPQLGGPRDWDLFSPAVFLLIPAALIIYPAKSNRRLPPHILPITVLSLCITISFAAVNASVTRAANRFCEIIEVSKFKNLFKEYGMLYNFAKNTPELEDRSLEFGLKAWAQPPYNKNDSVFMANELAEIFIDAQDKSRAYRYLGHSFAADSTNLKNHLLLVDYYRSFGETDKLPDLALRMERLFPANPHALLSAGMIFQEHNMMERAGKSLGQAYELNRSDPMTTLNYGIYHYDIGDYDRCIELLYGIKESDRFGFFAFYYRASAYLELGEIEKARASLTIAERLQKSADEKRMLRTLKQRLGN